MRNPLSLFRRRRPTDTVGSLRKELREKESTLKFYVARLIETHQQLEDFKAQAAMISEEYRRGEDIHAMTLNRNRRLEKQLEQQQDQRADSELQLQRQIRALHRKLDECEEASP